MATSYTVSMNPLHIAAVLYQDCVLLFIADVVFSIAHRITLKNPIYVYNHWTENKSMRESPCTNTITLYIDTSAIKDSA